MTGKPLIVKGNLADQVYELVRQRIFDLHYDPGDKLTIQQLAQEMDVSATPVRDALNRLAAEHLINFTPYRGFKIVAAPTEEDIRHSFEARLAVEPFAARIGCERASEAQLRDLGKIQQQIASRDYVDDYAGYLWFVRLNGQFHEAMVATSGNPLLLDAMKAVHVDLVIARAMYHSGVDDLPDVVREHNAIIKAFEQRNAEAVENAVTKHLTDGLQRVVAAHRKFHSG